MSEIFDVESNTITYHLQEIFKSEELVEDSSTTRKIRVVQNEGKREVEREIQFYNLDAIISVGYRVNSYKATQFRIWATSVLKEFMIKGFALDDQRLKQGSHYFGKDYFNELLERIREIRASERRFYQKITDLYAQGSIDYDAKSPVTKEFYAIVQNKLHHAVTDQTAAEIIKSRVSASKPNMGLTTWENSPDGKIQKTDVTVAKNYLTEDEIKELNIVVNMYLDYAELQATKKVPMKMVDWIRKLDAFLQFNEYDILTDAGKVSAKFAKELAEKEYLKFRVIQDKEFKSDFDKTVEQIKTTGKLPMRTPNLSQFLKKIDEVEEEKRKGGYLGEQTGFDSLLKAVTKVPKPEK